MEIFKDYINTINEAIKSDFLKDRKRSAELLYRTKGKEVFPSLQGLSKINNKVIAYDQPLGRHPDFNNLTEPGQFEEHWIISTFIDIKGSTNLFKKYNKETVAIIQSVVQKLSIDVSLSFSGYIHRLQGDGTFVYYGGKNISIHESVTSCLNACSIISYFMSTSLIDALKQYGFDENIYTRIGIDLGYDIDTLWSKAGQGAVSEITTTSLHTSLAAKMQLNAENNGIVVGDNIKNETDIVLFKPCCNRDENIKRYIFQIPDKNFNYTQYDFDWRSHLKTSDQFAFDPINKKIQLKSKPALLNGETLRPIAVKSSPYYH